MPSRYTARIMVPGRFDQTEELTEREVAQIANIFMIARGRALAEKIQRAADEARRVADSMPSFFTFSAGSKPFRTASDSIPPWMRGYSADYSVIDETHDLRRPRTPHSVGDALAVLRHYLPTADANLAPRHLVRRAKRATHPDTGGTATDFHLVTAAEAILRSKRLV